MDPHGQLAWTRKLYMAVISIPKHEVRSWPEAVQRHYTEALERLKAQGSQLASASEGEAHANRD